jgi:hypothetical protein
MTGSRYKGGERTLKWRHPELVSGSISPPAPPHLEAGWMLKQVQHDESSTATTHHES